MLILDSIEASETQVVLEAWLLIQSLLQEVYKSIYFIQMRILTINVNQH